MNYEPLVVDSITLAANTGREVNIVGNFLRVLATSGSVDIFVQIGDGRETQIPAGLGVDLPEGEKFSKVRFRNSEGSQVVVQYAIGNGKILDDRTTFTGTVNTLEAVSNTLATPAAISVPTTAPGAAQVAAASTTREVWVQNNGSFDLWVGDSNVDGANNRGVKIIPGGLAVFVTSAALYMRANGGTTTASVSQFSKV